MSLHQPIIPPFLILAIIVAGTLLIPISISTLQQKVYAIQIRTDTEPRSVAMFSSNLAPYNQTSNQIEIMEPSTTSSIPEKLSKAITPDGTITPLNTYKIKHKTQLSLDVPQIR